MNKKGFTLVELLAVIILLAIIAVISFAVVTDRIKDSRQRLYNVLVHDLEKAGEDYMLDNSNIDKYHLNTLCVSIQQLQEKNYLTKDSIVNPMTKQDMQGYIKIQYDTTVNQYKYTYIDECTDKIVKPIVETVLENEQIKVSGTQDGLYETIDKYVFKGNNPNNYIKIGGNTWRIVDIDKTTNMAKIIDLKDNQQQWPTNGLLDYLNSDFDSGSTYENLKTITNENSKWNTGKIEKLDTAVSIKSVEKQSSEYNTVGLLTVGEYIEASTDKECYSSNDCSSYLTTGKKYWLLNKLDDNKEWYVDDDELKNITVPTTEMYHIYPVVYLNVNTSVTGSGTETDPYIPN